jgi:hypothetical protein
MPTCGVHQHDAMAASGDMKANLFEVPLHRASVGNRPYKTRTFAMHRADGTTEIGNLKALIRRSPWPGALLGPNAGSAVLLT